MIPCQTLAAPKAAWLHINQPHMFCQGMKSDHYKPVD